MIELLRELPKEIKSKPSANTNYKGERFADIDFILYKIVNENIKLNSLIKVWKNTTNKRKRIPEKNIIIKDSKINRLKIVNDFILQCDCNEFKKHNDCIHIGKLKKSFQFT